MKTLRNYYPLALLVSCLVIFSSTTYAQKTRSMKATDAYSANPVYISSQAGSCYDITGNPEAKCIQLQPYDILPIEMPLEAGEDVTICKSESLELHGTSPSSVKTIWRTSGDGTFADPSKLNTVYMPGDHDRVVGGVVLFLEQLPGEGLDMIPTYDYLVLSLQTCIGIDDMYWETK